VFLTLGGRYQAYALGISWPSKLHHRGCRGSMWADVDMQVEVMRGQDTEIGWGWVFLTPRDRYRAYALGIAWPSKLCCGGCRGSTWVNVDMWVEVVRGWDTVIKRGWGFSPPKAGYRGHTLRVGGRLV
jgi:hypothetical protein